MRIRALSAAAAFLLLPASSLAQQPPAAPQVPPPAVTQPLDVGAIRQQGRVDIGLRATSISGDEARFSRFRDLRDGPFLSGFRIERETGSWFFLGEASNVGYRDQRFSGAAEAIGRMKLMFQWDQVPLFISGDARSLNRHVGNGVLDVADSVQQGLQNRTLTLADAVAGAESFEMRNRRHTASFDAIYMAAPDVDVKLRVKSVSRKGDTLQNFGLLTSPGGFTQELAVPLDHRTTDVRMGVEWANTRGLLNAGIDASWFDNSIPTVQFDNPQRFTDISAGASKGVVPMWPSNSLVTVSLAGAYKLPARTRATASLSFGRANQDEALVAPTVNTALVAPPLMRGTAAARANVRSMVYGLTSRPTNTLWLNARYRYYDYDNRTSHFEATKLIGDWATSTVPWENEPLSVRRHTAELDASFTPVRYLSVGAGYTRENATRSWRIFEDTAENAFRVWADSTGNRYFTVRLKFERSTREGSGFDAHLLEEVGEQPDMRHFDVANRTRTRTTGIFTVTPASWITVNASLGVGDDDYGDTGFGLRDNRNRAYGAGFDLVPADTVTAGVSYMRETYDANQYSRTASPAPSPQFTDPNRDWWIDSSDRVETILATLDLIKTLPRTDIRLSADTSDGDAAYVYGLRPTQTVFTTTPLAQLPTISNRLRGARADIQYFIRPDIALGVVYRYEDYDVRDFALDAGTLTSLVVGTTTIYSGYMYRPYTAHTGWLRLTYLW